VSTEPSRCPDCSSLGEYTEVEDDPLPPAARKLTSPSDALTEALSFRRQGLLECPSCGTYFHHRIWNPGGSCDAMRTCTHEAVRRMRISDVLLHLRDVRSDLQLALQERGSDALETAHFAALAAIDEEEQRLRARAPELLIDAVARIQDRHAGSRTFLAEHAGRVPHWYPSGYLEEMRGREARTAERLAAVVAEMLPLVPRDALPSEVGVALAALALDSQKGVSETLKRALAATAR
jgi:hypothetical protein